MHCSFGKYWFIDLDVTNVDKLHYVTLKILDLLISPSILPKSLDIGKVVISHDREFPKF